MPCEDTVLRESFIKNLPETISVSPTDYFVIEGDSGTSIMSFENFNLELTNTLFENEFNLHTTNINELSGNISEVIDVSNEVKNNIGGKFSDLLVRAEALALSAKYYEGQINNIQLQVNPDGEGVIKKLDIEQHVCFSSDGIALSGNHYRATDVYVNHSERNVDNFLDVTELVPEKHYTGSGGTGIANFYAQSAGVYVEVRNNSIILTPTPKAQNTPIECLTIVLSNIEFFEGQEDLVDIVKNGQESSLVSSGAFRGTLNDEFVDVLDFSYVVNKNNSTITIRYENTGSPGELKITDSPEAVETFDLRMDNRSTIVTVDVPGDISVPDSSSGGGGSSQPGNVNNYPGAIAANFNNSGVGNKESISVADAGDIFVAAGRFEPHAVTIWSISNGDLIQNQLIDVGDASSWVSSVSLRKNIMAVGQSGLKKVTLFKRGSNNTFTRLMTLQGSTGFGESVSLNSDESLVSVGVRPSDIQLLGSVEIYDTTTGTLRNSIVNIEPLNAAGRDYGFGYSVCLDNNRLVVGGGVESYGSVITYDWDGNQWNNTFTLIPFTASRKTGWSIDINKTASRMVFAESQANNGDGLAQAYTWSGTSYEISNIYTPPNGSGAQIEEITISGNGQKVAIGQGLWSQSNAANTGRIVVFDFPFTQTHEFFGPAGARLKVCDFDDSGRTLVAGCPGNGEIVLYQF